MCLSPWPKGDSPIFAANPAVFLNQAFAAAKIGTVPRERLRWDHQPSARSTTMLPDGSMSSEGGSPCSAR